jgi:hypothetical protein
VKYVVIEGFRHKNELDQEQGNCTIRQRVIGWLMGSRTRELLPGRAKLLSEIQSNVRIRLLNESESGRISH